MRQLVLTKARGLHDHDRTVDILFSTHVKREQAVIACLQNDIDFFDELTNYIRTIRHKKSPVQIRYLRRHSMLLWFSNQEGCRTCTIYV